MPKRTALLWLGLYIAFVTVFFWSGLEAFTDALVLAHRELVNWAGLVLMAGMCLSLWFRALFPRRAACRPSP